MIDDTSMYKIYVLIQDFTNRQVMIVFPSEIIRLMLKSHSLDVDLVME
jgi:hypothetical protein